MSDSARTASLVEVLGLARAPELMALVGGGGRSSFMFALGRGLPGRVVMTTPTRIFTAQMGWAALLGLHPTKRGEDGRHLRVGARVFRGSPDRTNPIRAGRPYRRCGPNRRHP